MKKPLTVLLFAVVGQSVHGAPSPYQAPHAPAMGADPSVPWQFAVAGTTIKVERNTMPARWEWPLAAPLRLKVPAQAFAWPGNDPGTLPGLVDDGDATEVTLVPYGCAKYRVALFPVTETAWRAAGGIELPKQQRAKLFKLREGKGRLGPGPVSNIRFDRCR